MFNTTGQVHYSGIQNEHDSIKLSMSGQSILKRSSTSEELSKKKMQRQVIMASVSSTKKVLTQVLLIGLILPKLFH